MQVYQSLILKETTDIRLDNVTVEGDFLALGDQDIYLSNCTFNGKVTIKCNHLQATNCIFKYLGIDSRPYVIEAQAASFSNTSFTVQNTASLTALKLKATFSSFYGCHFDLRAPKLKPIVFKGKALNLYGCYVSITETRFILSKSKAVILLSGGYYHLEHKCHPRLVVAPHAKTKLDAVATNFN